MSLVIQLIGQLNCQFIGCKTRKKLIGSFRTVYCFGQSFVSQIISSVYLEVGVGINLVAFILSL